MRAPVHSLQAGHCFEEAITRAHQELQRYPADWPLLLQLVELQHKLGMHSRALAAVAALDSDSCLSGNSTDLLVKLRILLVKADCLASSPQKMSLADEDQQRRCQTNLEG